MMNNIVYSKVKRSLYSNNIKFSLDYPVEMNKDNLTYNFKSMDEYWFYAELQKIVQKYKLGHIIIKKDDQNIFRKLYIIEIPKEITYKSAMKIWDQITDQMKNISEEYKMMDYFKNVAIILR